MLTPDACVALARSSVPNGTLLLHPLMGGLAPELGWSSLELFATRVLPRIRTRESGRISARRTWLRRGLPTPGAQASSGAMATDGDLLRRLSERETLALEVLYARYASYVMGISLRMLASREEAEEVVQDVFWQLWKAELALRPGARALLDLAVLGRALSLPRPAALARARAAARGPARARSHRGARRSRGGDLSWSSARRKCAPCSTSLPGDQRTAIELAFFRGLTHDEIAELNRRGARHREEPHPSRADRACATRCRTWTSAAEVES